MSEVVFCKRTIRKLTWIICSSGKHCKGSPDGYFHLKYTENYFINFINKEFTTEEPGQKFLQAEKPGQKFLQAEEPGQKFLQAEEPGQKFLQAEKPGQKFLQAEEPGQKFLQAHFNTRFILYVSTQTHTFR